MAPDEIAVLVALLLFALGGYILVRLTKKSDKDDNNNK